MRFQRQSRPATFHAWQPDSAQSVGPSWIPEAYSRVPPHCIITIVARARPIRAPGPPPARGDLDSGAFTSLHPHSETQERVDPRALSSFLSYSSRSTIVARVIAHSQFNRSRGFITHESPEPRYIAVSHCACPQSRFRHHRHSSRSSPSL